MALLMLGHSRRAVFDAPVMSSSLGCKHLMTNVLVKRIIRQIGFAITLIILMLTVLEHTLLEHVVEVPVRVSSVQAGKLLRTDRDSAAAQESVSSASSPQVTSTLTSTLTLTLTSASTSILITGAEETSPSLNTSAPGRIVLPPVEPLDVKGNIVIAGSSTLYPLTQSIYNRFVLDGYADEIQINNVGTGAGFRLFCEEKIADMVIASRRIELDELVLCTANNLTPIEFQIATDALSIVVSNQNGFVENVTKSELGIRIK